LVVGVRSAGRVAIFNVHFPIENNSNNIGD
jgi:hypothetical protein